MPDYPLSMVSYPSPDMYVSKQCVVRTNKVAPVIIKDCREEFQQLSDFAEPVLRGKLGDGVHTDSPLIQV